MISFIHLDSAKWAKIRNLSIYEQIKYDTGLLLDKSWGVNILQGRIGLLGAVTFFFNTLVHQIPRWLKIENSFFCIHTFCAYKMFIEGGCLGVSQTTCRIIFSIFILVKFFFSHHDQFICRNSITASATRHKMQRIQMRCAHNPSTAQSKTWNHPSFGIMASEVYNLFQKNFITKGGKRFRDLYRFKFSIFVLNLLFF